MQITLNSDPVYAKTAPEPTYQNFDLNIFINDDQDEQCEVNVKGDYYQDDEGVYVFIGVKFSMIGNFYASEDSLICSVEEVLRLEFGKIRLLNCKPERV